MSEDLLDGEIMLVNWFLKGEGLAADPFLLFTINKELDGSY